MWIPSIVSQPPEQITISHLPLFSERKWTYISDVHCLSWLHSMRSCNRIPISRSRIVQLTLRVAFLPEMDCLNEFLQRKTIWKISLCSTNASRCLLGLSRTVRLRELICMLYMPILNKANLFYAYVTLFEIGGSHIRFRKNQYHINQ